MKKEATTSRNWLINFKVLLSTDIGLLLITVGLVCFGLLMVYSSSFIFAQERTGDGFAFIKKQLLFAALGLIGMVFVSRVPYRKWYDWAYPMLGMTILMLVLVLVPGVGARVGGAQRWLRLGFFNFQPGELAKFVLIIFAARQLSSKADRLHRFTAGILSVFLLALPAMVLLLAQPDFGTVAMISMVLFGLIFLAGVSYRYLASIIASGSVMAAILIFGSTYRRMRLQAFLDPWSDPSGKGFQIIQSLLGFSNGGIWGTGLGNGKEKLFYLPEAHNDFIFAVIGEELGFIGVAVLVAAYLFFLFRGFRVSYNANRASGDLFALLLGSGITLAIVLQAFVNMSVVLGLVPTKGLTLPLISYGGSALMVDLLAVGVLLGLSREISRQMITDSRKVERKVQDEHVFEA